MWLRDWMADILLVGSPHWARYLASGLITVLSLAMVTVLWRQLGAIPDPSLILLLTVAVATYLAGGMAGMLSAAIVLFCSFILFSHPLYPFRYSDLDWRQMMVITITCPLIAFMVGSLKEQVDRLKIVTREAEALREEIRRLEFAKDAQHLCEQRFRSMTESLPDYAVCTIDAGGMVMNWNPGAERLLGYTDPEIRGQSYSRFFTKEDLLARRPERFLELARFSGRAEEEGWHLRKGGGRFRSTVDIVPVKNLHGGPGGYLMVIRDLTELSEAQDTLRKALVELGALKAGRGPGA